MSSMPMYRSFTWHLPSLMLSLVCFVLFCLPIVWMKKSFLLKKSAAFFNMLLSYVTTDTVLRDLTRHQE